MMRIAGVPRLAVALLLLLGGHASGASRPEPGKVVDGKLTPGHDPVAAFGDPSSATCPRGGLHVVLAAEVGRQAKAAGRPAPAMTDALCAIADTFVSWKEPAQPREGVVAFVSEWFGLVVPARQVLVVTMATDNHEAISERLAETVIAFSKPASEPRYGAATVLLPKSDRLAQQESRVVLVLLDDTVAIQPPLPRRLALGQSAILAGRLNAATDPRVTISEVSGQVVSPEQPPGQDFKANVSCSSRPGPIRVQISGVQQGQRRALASFSVACGTELATSVPLRPPSAAADEAGQLRQVFQGINDERSRAGLAPLAWDDAVAGVARSVAQDLSDESRRATATSPAELNAALQKAGAASALVLVNPAEGNTVGDAQERLLASPIHRANMLNPDATTAGVGSVTVTGKDGRGTAYLAELFVKFVARAETSDIRAQIAAAIAERRAEAKVAPLKTHPALQGAAQKYADELALAHGDLPEARDEQIVAEVKKAFKGAVNMLAGASTAPLEYAKQPKLVGPGDALGVGVAQGDHPILGRNTFFVVILRGTSR
jgi:uncharacterized protein YkwD